ncbi:DUF4112 domain-containing protein [Rubripirellula reticaptiva]|uniref:DUF4112 domain-containing protein n=1 Tax=Rubripirellula reticaptiva TaxID=2528013 RepID=A0A5C6EHW9_9BACT|nr:DUF4112 domain-containing protein [Rubripirellula reticaptiva]TWU46819.1 hypothetical protein Poly59_57920 [Rubripirellula reticaptiva]
MSTVRTSGVRFLGRKRQEPSNSTVTQPGLRNMVTENAIVLRRVQRVARLMDSSMTIPGTSIRFGLDSAFGLIPGVGDIGTAAVGGWILLQAHQSGLRKRQLARMAANIAVDLTIGSVPLVGDLFDVYWKSNLRNARLLEEHLKEKLEPANAQP